jgi:hypothetical protein
MDVLSNGMKANFWIGVDEEPDIDRFVDEQIMIDMDRFLLIGTLEKVATCKKKNEEKEYEYFKQITVQITNICLASDNNFNIQIPNKKDEFLFEVKFRYAPEPEQVTGDGMEAADDTDTANMYVGGTEAEEINVDETPADEINEINVDETPAPVEEYVPAHLPDNEVIDDEKDTEPDMDTEEAALDAALDESLEAAPDEPDFSFENEPAANAIVETETDPVPLPDVEDDSDEIDWGD